MEPGVDEVTMLTSLTIFLLYSSAEVSTVEPLQTRCTQAFRASLESKDPVVSKESQLEILNTIYTVLFKSLGSEYFLFSTGTLN